MWFDGIRQPNTMYVASVSRGKDSTAMLRAIQLMGWPLDAIVSVDIWATDTIPAELPPMVEFKEEWDKKCFEQFGVPVTRLCAMRKCSQSVQVERESRGREPHDEECHSRYTYEYGFYQPLTRQEEGFEHRIGLNRGFPWRKGQWCTRDLKLPALRESNIREAILSCSKAAQAAEREREREREMRQAAWIPTSQGELVQHAQASAFQPTQSKGFLSTMEDCQRHVIERNDRQVARANRVPGKAQELVQHTAQSRSSRKFSIKPQNEGQKINIVHYIGIAADEPIRIERHIKDPKKILPLVQIGWDEDLCGLESIYMDMLSPTYESSCRDGCWFCHNQGVNQLRNLRKKYPALWELLLKWDNDSPVTFHADGHTVHDFDRRFQLEDEGMISSDDKTFRWSMLDSELNYRLF